MSRGQRSRSPTGEPTGPCDTPLPPTTSSSPFPPCAFVLLRDSLSPPYRELLEMTCRLGNLLRRRGVKRGDCVTIYMPPCPMAVASMLACARIGAAHNVVFAGFSAEALTERIRDGETGSPNAIFTDSGENVDTPPPSHPPWFRFQPSPAP